MPSASNALIQYESDQTSFAMASLTNSGDNKRFSSAATYFSDVEGYSPDVRPDGIITGGAVTPAASAANNQVDIAAISCYLAGVKTAVAAATNQAITRPATNVAKVSSITVNSSGAIAVVAGTDGASASFTETRGAAGGPPFIPVGSIEIAQVRLTTSAAAKITDAQIFDSPNVHQERYDQPMFTIDYYNGDVVFSAALAAIHTGNTAKNVSASCAEPIFADVPFGADFTAPEQTHSVSSTAVYGGAVASSSSSLGQGGFTAYLTDGVSDPLIKQKNKNLWYRFYPDKNKTPNIMCQGKLGIARTWPAANGINAKCTISAANAPTEVGA